MRKLTPFVLALFSIPVWGDRSLPEVLTLQAAVQQGLSGNHRMRAQQYRVANAQLDLEVAERTLKPQIRSFASSDARSGAEMGSRYGLVMDRQLASGASLGVGYYNSSFGDKHLSEVRFSYRLPFFGNHGQRIRNNLDDAGFNLQHEQNMAHWAEIQLHQEISQRFYAVVLAKEQLRLARRLHQLSRQRLEETLIRQEGDQASQLDVTRSKIGKTRASQHVQRSQHRLNEARNQLCMVIGVPPTEHFLVDDTIVEPGENSLADASLEELVSMAYEKRLDFALTRHEIARIERSIDQERSSVLPNIEVSLQYSLISEDDTFAGAHSFNDKRFGISVKMDTDFSRTGKTAEQRRKLLEYSRRRENFQHTLNMVRVDIQRVQAEVLSARGEAALAQELTLLAEQEKQRGIILAQGGQMDTLNLFELDQRIDEAGHQHRTAQIALVNANYALHLLVGDTDVGG